MFGTNPYPKPAKPCPGDNASRAHFAIVTSFGDYSRLSCLTGNILALLEQSNILPVQLKLRFLVGLPSTG